MLFRILVLAFMACFVLAQDSQAFYVNEILADPAVGIAGDANGDGISSTTDDEFLELYNPSLMSLNLTGWYLNDALRTRHVFPENTILSSQGFLVVFGGGTPQLPGIDWQVASTGTLSLNNTAETVSFFDSANNLIEQIIYGADAGFDQSIVRSPEGTGEAFVRHSTLPNANGALFSPGHLVNPPEVASPVVPELSTLAYWFSFLGLMPFMRWARL